MAKNRNCKISIESNGSAAELTAKAEGSKVVFDGEFSANAWEFVNRYIYSALQRGGEVNASSSDDEVMVVCCGEGDSKVEFRLQRGFDDTADESHDAAEENLQQLIDEEPDIEVDFIEGPDADEAGFWNPAADVEPEEIDLRKFIDEEPDLEVEFIEADEQEEVVEPEQEPQEAEEEPAEKEDSKEFAPDEDLNIAREEESTTTADKAVDSSYFDEFDDEYEDYEIPVPESVMSVGDALQRSISKNLRKAFTVNDRFRFCRELFGNNGQQMNDVLDKVNEMKDLASAERYFYNELGWDKEQPDVADFMTIITNHFA